MKGWGGPSIESWSSKWIPLLYQKGKEQRCSWIHSWSQTQSMVYISEIISAQSDIILAKLTKITINLRYYLSEANKVYKKSKMLTNSKTYKSLTCISKASWHQLVMDLWASVASRGIPVQRDVVKPSPIGRCRGSWSFHYLWGKLFDPQS